MQKNITIILLILSITTLSANKIILKELSISSLNSTSYEIVNHPTTGKKLSELIWEAKDVKMLGVRLDYKNSNKSFISFNYKTNITNGNSEMDDYDWTKDDTTQWSHWSNHPNTDLKYLTILDISLNNKLSTTKNNIERYFLFGYRVENKKFMAYDGTYIYSSTNGFRDESGTFSGLGITYEETFKTLYLGMTAQKQYKGYTLNGKFIYSPLAKATNKDNHHLRYFINDNTFQNSTMMGIDLGIEIPYKNDTTIEFTYSQVKYSEADGTTTRTYYEGATEQTAGTILVYGGAGISNSYSMLSFSIKKRF